jgi:hypothetical protein
MTCDKPTATKDLNPKKGEYFVNLKWGRNMYKQGASAAEIKEGWLEGYKVFIVDDNYRMIEEVATVPKDGKSSTAVTSCCDKEAYSKTFKGMWPAEGRSFMVVPYSTGIGAQKGVKAAAFKLPMGQFTDVYDDKATADKDSSSQMVDGSLKLTVSNVKDVMDKQDQFMVVMQKAIASSLDGVGPENVAINKISVSTSRRLGAASRQLNSGSIVVDYTIITPKDYKGEAITKEAIEAKKAKLQDTIKTTAADLGITTTVADVVAEKTDSKPVHTGTGDASPTSGTVTSTAAASVFVAIGAAICSHLLA